MALAATSCPGGVLLEWSPYGGAGFSHYGVVRGDSAFSIPSGWPPPAPLVGLKGSSLQELSKTTFIDTSLASGATAWYRAMAFDATEMTIGASPEKSATRKPVAAIGGFSATATPGGADLAWTPFAGPDACFTWYKVTWSSSNPNLSYLGDNDGSMAVGPRTASSATIALTPGSWYVRIEAVLASSAQKVITGRSEVATVVVAP
jgi:hypothetical protein